MYKVLIVDDEPFVREGLKLIINWHKYGFVICGEASDGDEALKLIKELSPDLVITDIKMPEMDGLEFIKKAKGILGVYTNFIILSGYNEVEFAQRAIKYNVIDYLLKPIEEDDLISILQKIYKNLKDKELKNRLDKNKLGNYSKKYMQQFFDNIGEEKIRYVQVEIDISKWIEKLEPDELCSNFYKIEEIIYETINEENINCLHHDELGKYGIILSKSILKYFDNNIGVFVNSLYKKITNVLESNCLIIVGKEINGLSNLKKSYNSCIEARQTKFFYYNNIIFYDKIKEMKFSYSFNDDISVEMIMSVIESKHENNVKDIVNEILENIINNKIAPEIIHSYFIILTSKVITCVCKKYGEFDKFLRNNINFKRLQGSSVDEIRETLVSFFIDISEYIKSLSNRQNASMYEIEKYINNNYQYDITLKKLSIIFFINPVYLGKLLKKHLGMYFNDYLETVRIDQAKKLLRRSNLKLCEIANKVGYANSNYFINKFEKSTHVTPTQYKNSGNHSS